MLFKYKEYKPGVHSSAYIAPGAQLIGNIELKEKATVWFNAVLRGDNDKITDCTPGFIINCHSLLQNHPNPSKETITSWLSSNICRCTSYQEINEAVMSVINRK